MVDGPANAHSVINCFAEQVTRRPSAAALLADTGPITYLALDQWSNRISQVLRQHRVGRGDLVPTLTLQRPLSVAAYLAILKLGAAYVPIDPSLPDGQIGALFARLDAPLALVDEELLARLPAIPEWSGDIFCLQHEAERIAAADPRLESPPPGAEDLAYIMFTSGSTGAPKGVMVPHRGIVRLVKGAQYARMDESEIFLQFAPLAFDASTLEIWAPLLNGGALAFIDNPRPSPLDIGEAVRRHGVTTLWLTSGLFNLLIEEVPEDLMPLRQILTGGDVLSVAHAEKARRLLPHAHLVNCYGPTENTTFTTAYALPPTGPMPSPAPIGKAIPGTTTHILDSNMQPVPDGEIGELYTGGLGVALGYFGEPERTERSFLDDPFAEESEAKLYRTGDLVLRNPDGDIEFIGRADLQVKINGKRVELSEIEAILEEMPNVADAVATVREIRPGEKQVVAFLRPAQAWPDEAAIMARLRQILSPEAVPARLNVMERFPVNRNGKLDRTALLATLFEPPRNPGGENGGEPVMAPAQHRAAREEAA
ncbi:amino acid adenylation domain-containing protein [Rhodopseudomonas julia]|uniref:Amino acid adenylation domain-containing protein n=1 Tax=Rhodopseudomonas julia TaxID=200617 RepID=A0ABU0C5S5_9BRAD|nr:amino acid adenylation domain-containing protein [Rhodopseudomonas julia]MDQ0325873.1 amino acid adenylation domain-containing protein [Rhodopseudomonas julia]